MPKSSRTIQHNTENVGIIKRRLIHMPLSMVVCLASGTPYTEMATTDNASSRIRVPEAEWNKTFGGSNDDVDFSVLQAEDGGYVIAGVAESHGADKQDVWMIKVK